MKRLSIVFVSVLSAFFLLSVSVFGVSGIPPSSDTCVFIGLPCSVSYDVNWSGTWKSVSGSFSSSDNVLFTIIGSSFYLFSDDINATYTYNFNEPNAGSGSSLRSFSSSSNITNGSDILYYRSEPVVGYFFAGSSVARNQEYPEGAVNFSGTIANNASDIISAFYSYSSPSVVQSTFSIPAGYVAFISSPSGSTFSLVHNFGFNSRAFSDQWGDGSSLQAYKTGVSSLPSASTSFPLSGMTDISYVRDQNRNLLGQSRVGLSSITSGSSGYTVIYNPLYRSDYKNYNEQVSAEEYYYNSTIYLSASGISFFRLYPLSEAYTSLTTIEGSSISGYEDYTDITVDPDTGEVIYTDQDGGVSLSPPAFGGTNQTPEPVGTANWLQQITALLGNVVQSLGTIFGFAYEAIVTLVGASSAFVVALGSLYAWLPAPLSSVLISAITVAITIGVFKAFL